MRASRLVAVSLCLVGATIALAQTTQRTEGPGLKAGEDSRYKDETALCKKYHPVIRAPGAPGSRPPATASSAPEAPPEIKAIPAVVAAGEQWRTVWNETGNNADGIVGTPKGVLVAQQDNSDVVLVDASGQAQVVYQDTNTGGAVSINKQRQTFIVERGLHQGIWEVAPDHKLLADTIDGDSLDCLGSGGLNDLTAAANGGCVHFTLGNASTTWHPLARLRAKAMSHLMRNGIILSRCFRREAARDQRDLRSARQPHGLRRTV